MRPMRWVASLFALGLMMALFHRVTAGGPLEARATLALGFLTLAALVGGDLAQRVRLPRITGYLLIGFGVGPAWLSLVRSDEVQALHFVAEAALALIALAAGSELSLEALGEARTALARLATSAVAFPFVIVALVALSVSPWFPLTVHQPWHDRVTVALVLGTLAAASSPALTMAMIGELDARGPIARSLLGTTVVQNVIVVALFALVVAGAKVLASAGAVRLGIAGLAGLELGGSVAVGSALGYLMSRYLRVVDRDTALFLVAVGCLAALAGRVLRLEATLLAIAAGFYLANFSRGEGERLRRVLQGGSRPVYVVFFALAGAGLQVRALAVLWPWVLLFIGLRVVSLRYGFLWAGRHAAVTPTLARHGWLGLISQAGIASALAELARRAFPQWGVSLETVIVAMIGVHEVAGPVCFRQALVRAGELLEGPHSGEAAMVGASPVAARGGA